MASTTSQTATGPAPSSPIPPLRNGDRLTRDEFERRYDAMPHLKKAELIEGIVYIPSPDCLPPEGGIAAMSSPVSFTGHSAPHFDLIGWLAFYRMMTPGVRGGDNGSVRLDLKNMPQPDGLLIILPSHGGKVQISDDDYVEGGPELVAEVAYSSVSYDLHAKLEAYRRNDVLEYVVWRVEDEIIDWFILRNGRYERLPLGPDGLYRSEVFPGLWLDPAALIGGDLVTVSQVVQRGLASPEHADFVARLQRAAAPR